MRLRGEDWPSKRGNGLFGRGNSDLGHYELREFRRVRFPRSHSELNTPRGLNHVNLFLRDIFRRLPLAVDPRNDLFVHWDRGSW